MSKYAEIAIAAARGAVERGIRPDDAWSVAAYAIYPGNEDARTKACPKNTFLFLCQLGLIRGIAPGAYTRARENGDYALAAIEALQRQPELVSEPRRLWHLAVSHVAPGVTKKPNDQMHVVCRLWEAGLISEAAVAKAL